MPVESGPLPEVEATADAEVEPTPDARVGSALRRALLGPPLRSSAIARERMRKLVALPVLSADALSSVAYGPEAMLAVLVLAGSGGLSYSLPIAGAIAFLMLAVGVSYRQTIRAYPHGGGSYIVATDNLGRVPGLVAAAGLMTDYILTVAVSVASGLEAVTSAIPSLAPARVVIGVGVIVVLLAGNLRGVRQAGALFAAPTYAFILAMFVLIAVGLIDAGGRGFHATPRPPLTATEGVGVLLILRAFASGSTAMTGIEAISNAVPVFKPTEWRNARTTLTWMVGLLITLFVGTIAIVQLNGVVPNAHETMLSQLAHRSFGSGFMYPVVQAATAAILLLAANTAYNDFPRVLFLLARDFQAPRLFLRLGDRLAFSNGIIVLSAAALVIFVGFGGKTAPLIPLYAVGVFLAFTLSQTGMVMHWWRLRDPHWRRSLAINATGALLSAIVFITAAITKFTEGAWVSLLVVVGFVTGRKRDPPPLQGGGRGDRVAPARDRGAAARDRAERSRRRRRRERRRAGAAGAGDGGDARGDPPPDPRGGRRARPRQHARARVRRVAGAAGAGAARQPRRRGGRALSRILAHVGRSPAARGRRLAVPRDRRADDQLHRVTAPPAPRADADRDPPRTRRAALVAAGAAQPGRAALRRALRPLPKIVVTSVPFHLPR